jgi:hypothetical protein
MYRWDKQPVPVAATFTFSILNSYSEKSFVVDVNEKRMFGHSPGNSKVCRLYITALGFYHAQYLEI